MGFNKSIVALTDGTLQVTENKVVMAEPSLLKMNFVTLKSLSCPLVWRFYSLMFTRKSM